MQVPGNVRRTSICQATRAHVFAASFSSRSQSPNENIPLIYDLC